MKRLLLIFTACLSLTSCESTWDEEVKDMFHQSCMEDAVRWSSSEAKARAYCDCTLDKTMKKYPHYADALNNIDSVIADPDIKGCRTEWPNK